MNIRYALSWAAMLLFFSGCGDQANFVGNGGQADPNSSEATVGTDPRSRVDTGRKPNGTDPNNNNKTPVGPVGEGFELSWLWPCASETITPDIPESQFHKVIVGEGVHSISRNDFDKSKVYFKGRACDVSERSRNVIFVIDVSYSMRLQQDNVTPGYDPMVNGTCGRMEAVRSIINAGSSSDVRYGIVTFDKDLQESSSALFSDPQDLFDDVVSSSGYSTIEEVLCAGIDGTNYENALVKAKDLLDSNSFVGSQREIYFLSDGEPADGDEGKDVAADLHKDTTIASVMIGNGTDTILKNNIASKDSNGNPLHRRASDVDDLSRTLIDLTKNYIAEAQLVFDSVVKDFTSNLNGYEFAFGGYKLDAEVTESGLEVEFRYRDRFGTTQTKTGKLNWVD